MQNKQRYLSIEIYKPAKGDCSNYGFSYLYHEAYIPCKDGPHEESKISEERILDIVEHRAFPGYYYLVPRTLKNSGKHSMFGGCFGWTSDSRWTITTGTPLPLKIHDRVE